MSDLASKKKKTINLVLNEYDPDEDLSLISAIDSSIIELEKGSLELKSAIRLIQRDFNIELAAFAKNKDHCFCL